MTKSNHTILTIFILITITIGVIFAYTNISPSNHLNANDTQKPPQTANPPFEFLPARTSNMQYIEFENNFGGSENDSIKQVYNLDFYYIIGNTESQTHYMQENKQNSNIFVIKATRSGSVVSVALPTTNYPTTYTDSHATSTGIYILAKEHGKQNTIVLLYSYQSQSISEITVLKNQTPLYISKSDKIIIATSHNNLLNTVFYNENNKTFQQSNSNISPTEVLLAVSYKNGAMVFVNTTNSFYAVYFSEKSNEIILSADSYTLHSFNIYSFGYLFILKNPNNIYTIFCDNTFKILTTNLNPFLNQNPQSLFANSANYVVSVNSLNTINVLILSSRGDLVFNLNLPYLVKEILFLKQDNSNFQIYAIGADNSLKIITLSSLTNEISKVILPITNLSSLISLEKDVDNNFILFGSANHTSNALKHNFGKQDVFMMKLRKLY